MLQRSSDPQCGEGQGDGGEGVGMHLMKPLPEEYAFPPFCHLQALVLSLWDCDISLLIGLSVSRHSPISPSTCSCLISQETVVKGATESCRVGEWQNLSYISTDRSHNSPLCPWSSSSVWPHVPMWPDPFLGVSCSGHTGYTVTFQATCPQPSSLASE